jgi:transposase InsO family protein
MKDTIQQQRVQAVQRYHNCEKPAAICASLGHSKSWLYKWINRFDETADTWFESHSKCPLNNPNRTSGEIEEIVKMVRLHLYNNDLFCGSQAIRWELEDLNIRPLPSIRTIDRILSRNGLTHRRTGSYEPKGTAYPKLPALLPNQTHQADLLGPRHLKGPVRFYSINAMDAATNRCGTSPSLNKSSKSIIDAFLAIWIRLGIPDNIQLDNAMSFYGTPAHPRAMGQVIRFCLHYGIEPWFIPLCEPWRNGIVEKFNSHYQQLFLNRTIMASFKELETASLAFEQRHNGHYRYSKLGGKTPIKALTASKESLRFPQKGKAPRLPLPKPETGKYHIVRLIRSDCNLNIFSEVFPVPPELMYEYVVATIDVKDQKLKLFLEKTQIDEIDYRLR